MDRDDALRVSNVDLSDEHVSPSGVPATTVYFQIVVAAHCLIANNSPQA
jgi:hypothetical protein